MSIQESIQDVQESIQEVTVSIQDEIASKAVRKSTLRSIKEKKKSRLKQLKADYEKQIQEINIQYAEDPERLKAKYAAADYAKSEKAKKRAEKRIENEKKEIELSKTIRKYSLSEEIGSSIVQGIGACLFIAATAILDTLGISEGMDFRSLTIVCYSLFGASMILMYIFSLLCHALTNFVAKQVFSRLSHIFAFLVIGFAYSAYSITKVQGTQGWILFGIVWGLVLFGTLFNAIAGTKYSKVNLIIYALSGFSGLFVCKTLYEVLSSTSFGMLIAAAAFYLIGIVFYSLRKIKYMHLIGNCLMLAGSIYVFFSMFFIN